MNDTKTKKTEPEIYWPKCPECNARVEYYDSCYGPEAEELMRCDCGWDEVHEIQDEMGSGFIPRCRRSL